MVDTSKLDSAASKIKSLAGDYEAEYKKLFSVVQKMKSSWDGKDNVAYTTQIEGFRNDFEKMKSLMDDYANFLTKIANTYRETQESIASRAKTLSQGS